MLLTCQHSITLNCSPWCSSAHVHIVTILGAISGAISHRPPLPPYKVRNHLHSGSGWFKVGLGWLVNAYSSHSIPGGEDGSSHSIHKAKEVGPQIIKGIGTWDTR